MAPPSSESDKGSPQPTGVSDPSILTRHTNTSANTFSGLNTNNGRLSQSLAGASVASGMTMSSNQLAAPIQHQQHPAIPPMIVNKPSLQNVVFKQPISIRYLKPPTPPPPGPIVIREKRPAMPPSLPPRVIRQQLAGRRTPEPLVVRERPPTPPRIVKPVIIEKHLPVPPPQPQQVIVERFNPPRKPRKIVFEKWLPYKQPRRKIILQKAPPLPKANPQRNVIIEYSRPTAISLPEYIVEGVFIADPLTYTYSPHPGELKVVDKIYDLPPPSAARSGRTGDAGDGYVTGGMLPQGPHY